MLGHAVMRHSQTLHRTPSRGDDLTIRKSRTVMSLSEIASNAVGVCKPEELGVQRHKPHLLADNPASG